MTHRVEADGTETIELPAGNYFGFLSCRFSANETSVGDNYFDLYATGYSNSGNKFVGELIRISFHQGDNADTGAAGTNTPSDLSSVRPFSLPAVDGGGGNATNKIAVRFNSSWNNHYLSEGTFFFIKI